jgi:two-component system phosphate regulon response regulator OmpR
MEQVQAAGTLTGRARGPFIQAPARRRRCYNCIMTGRILIIDDDQRLAGMVSDYLGTSGYRVTAAYTAYDGQQRLKREQFDALILDLMLPDADGLEVCRRIRQSSDVPVLMLTARGDAMDRVVGLEIGADDYLPKPFEPRELLARLRAIMRRKSNPAIANDVTRYGRLEIDRGGRRVLIDGEERALTSYQFALLDALAAHAGRVMSRDALMDLTKGEQLEAFDRSVDVHISRIRAAIEDDPKKPRRIITIRGAGYVFAKEQDR